jgi:DNA-binding beta-propeller fold protein YncE
LRKIDLSNSEVSTLAGNGTPGIDDGEGAAARFNQPYNVRVDAQGDLWVPDQLNHAIRRVTPAGLVSTLAGTGKAGFADGDGTAAQFNNPTGVAPLPDGGAVVTDRNNNRLRMIDRHGTVTTIAGSEAGFGDGPTVSARFNQPLDVVFDANRSRLLVSEDKGHRIRTLIIDNP